MLTMAIIATAIAVLEFWLIVVLLDKIDALQEKQFEQSWNVQTIYGEIFDKEKNEK